MKMLAIPDAITAKEAARLWVKVDRNGPTVRAELGPCWLWLGYRPTGMHGRILVRGFHVYTHRLSYTLEVGPIPEGMNVCHACDVPACVRPDHLFLGTQQDNIADMRAKGRGTPPPIRRGLQNANAHLTDEQVVELRARRARGEPQRAVAAVFGVSQSTVWRLAHGMYRGEAR